MVSLAKFPQHSKESITNHLEGEYETVITSAKNISSSQIKSECGEFYQTETLNIGILARIE